MSYKKLVWVVVLVALMASSCTLTYPGAKAATPIPTKAFTNPLPTNSDPMKDLESFATSTALAKTAIAGGGTPVAPNNQVTSTPVIPGGITLTPSVTPVVVGGSTSTPVGPTAVPPTLITSRPATYTLQQFEFVYCIARRFNVDPDDVLALNGLFDSETVYAGTVLKIPQSGAFPGTRALRAHPTTYTVTGNSDTNIYGVACVFGDVDPASIAQRNNLPLSATLTIGQQINIP